MKTLELNLKNWFLTINPKAQCYGDLDFICNSLENCNWAYIKHDKEESSNNGHYHLVLCFDNKHSFTSIMKKFKGADIEEMKGAYYQALLYLTHESKDKTPYDRSDIVTNNANWVNSAYERKMINYQYFDKDKMLQYIYEDKIDNIYKFYTMFGYDVLKSEWRTYQNFLIEMNNNVGHAYDSMLESLQKEAYEESESTLIDLEDGEIIER